MKTLFISLFSFLALSGFAQVEADTQKEAGAQENVKLAKNNFYLSPFNLIVNQFLIGYERDFRNTRHSIVFLQGAILGDSYNDYFYNGYGGTDWGLTSELQYRFRLISVTNPRGKAKNPFRFDFYVAPFAAYQYLNYYAEYGYYDNVTGEYTSYPDPQESHAGSAGVLFGTRYTFFERFTVDVYTGGGMKFSNKSSPQDYNYDIFRPNYRGIIGKANLQIGVAF